MLKISYYVSCAVISIIAIIFIIAGSCNFTGANEWFSLCNVMVFPVTMLVYGPLIFIFWNEALEKGTGLADSTLLFSLLAACLLLTWASLYIGLGFGITLTKGVPFTSEYSVAERYQYTKHRAKHSKRTCVLHLTLADTKNLNNLNLELGCGNSLNKLKLKDKVLVSFKISSIGSNITAVTPKELK